MKPVQLNAQNHLLPCALDETLRQEGVCVGRMLDLALESGFAFVRLSIYLNLSLVSRFI